MELKKDNLVVLNHPLIEHNLTLLREKDACPEIFRAALKRITYFLFAEATKNLKTKQVNTITPIQPTITNVVDSEYEVVIAPILRAGLIFSDIALEFIPFASVQHIGMYRDECTLQPVWYFDKSYMKYKSPEKTLIYILDPMLATGNSGKAALDLFARKGIPEKNITFMSLISAPEGVHQISSNYPDIRILTAGFDEKLNSSGYIIPGLGDAGDRIFNTPGT